MKLFNFKKQPVNYSLKSTLPSEPIGDLSIVKRQEDGIFKTYIPNFLYKPPYGYPRSENIPLIRQTAKNGYVFSIIKTICDAVANTKWDITYKEDIDKNDVSDLKRKEIIDFFNNPNGNKESFGHILRVLTKDILELDSGVIIKVFNVDGKLGQMFARDGGSFLKNPDIYGYMGNRDDLILPEDNIEVQSYNETEMIHYYNQNYKNQAAYFQYGWTSASMPIPYGKNEVVYMMQNPRSDSIYGQSPVSLLSDILYTLIYGSMYNLDFYMNNNMPEGFMSIIGANVNQITAMKERFEQQFRKKDENTGFFRRIAFRLPWTNHEVKFTPFQLDPKTMQIIEQQQWFTKIVWSCFGVTADEMGFTENSNRATGETQSQLAKDKATKPILKLIEYHINQEIIPEFDTNELQFKFINFNLNTEIKKYELYELQQRLGVMTPEMIANKEGLDIEKVLEAQEKKEEQDKLKLEQSFNINNQEGKKALLIKEVPDDIDIDDDEEEDILDVGDSVKVVTGTQVYLDKIGKIEKIVNNKTVIVRFDNGIDVFNAEQLVLIEQENETSKLKAKDPFNNTFIEKKIMHDIFVSGKKIKKALSKLKNE